MSRLIDLTGQKFGRLTVIKQVENNSCGAIQWLCECDCGNKTITTSGNLKYNHTQSCGCLQKEKLQASLAKHNIYHTRIYKIFYGIKKRCYNEHSRSYHNYGGRGVKVCDEWLNDVKAFYNWAMTNGYQENLTIDRINFNGDYTPENCRWVDMKTQQRNRRNNHLVDYKGEIHCIAEWAEILNIKKRTLYNRIITHHWSIERAFTTK